MIWNAMTLIGRPCDKNLPSVSGEIKFDYFAIK